GRPQKLQSLRLDVQIETRANPTFRAIIHQLTTVSRENVGTLLIEDLCWSIALPVRHFQGSGRRNGGRKTTSAAFRNAFSLDTAQRRFGPWRNIQTRKARSFIRVAVIGHDENDADGSGIVRNRIC